MLIGMFGHIEADDTRTSLCELTYVTAQPNASVAMIHAPRGICLSRAARAARNRWFLTPLIKTCVKAIVA